MIQFVVSDEPMPVVSAAEAVAAGVFSSSDSTAAVEGALAAAQAAIDGPFGWLGRCIGDQEIQMTVTDVCDDTIDIPFPPVTEIVEVAHIGSDGAETISETDSYWPVLLGSNVPRLMFSSSPPTVGRGESLRVTYRAGYETVPHRIKQAIMFMARNLITATSATGSAVGPLRSETIEGVGRWDYSSMSGDKAAQYMDSQVCALLAGYRIFHL